jgi:ACS family glucarate transporter-like MFS transporter
MNRRWLISILLVVFVTLNYIDRVALSVAGPYIAKQFNLGPADMGILYSSFFYTYIILVIPMGFLTDRFGTRRMNAWALGIWSLAAIITGFINGFVTLLLARLLLGAGESPAYPACNRVINEWIPTKERGIVTGIFNSGCLVGPAIGIIAASYLIQIFDWSTSFYILGSLGFIWLAVWLWLYNTPEKAWWLKPAELQFILQNRKSAVVQQDVQKMSLGSLLRQKTMWGLLIAQGTTAYSLYLFLTWLPTYLLSVRGLRLVQAGWYGSLPYLIAAIALVLLCKFSDRAQRQDLTTGARRKFICVYMLLGSVILLVPYVESFAVMECLLVMSISFFVSANTLMWALTNDMIVDKESTGITTGLVVFGGNTFGFLAPLLTGFIIEYTHSYTLSFVAAGVMLFIGATVLWFCVRKPLQPTTAL